jgi:hypothetical protein
MKHRNIELVNKNPQALALMEKTRKVSKRFLGLIIGCTKKGYFAELPDGSKRTRSRLSVGLISPNDLRKLSFA